MKRRKHQIVRIRTGVYSYRAYAVSVRGDWFVKDMYGRDRWCRDETKANA